MKPIYFKEHNAIFAKNQKEYLSLPVYKDENGKVISCWKASIRERIKFLLTGKLWFMVLTFDNPLQPQKPMIDYPFVKYKER